MSKFESTAAAQLHSFFFSFFLENKAQLHSAHAHQSITAEATGEETPAPIIPVEEAPELSGVDGQLFPDGAAAGRARRV